MGASMSHKPMGFHGLLQGQIYLTSEPSDTGDAVSYKKGITKDCIILHIDNLKPEFSEIRAAVLNAQLLLHGKNIVFPLHTSIVLLLFKNELNTT
jgi:hypothetical protein